MIRWFAKLVLFWLDILLALLALPFLLIVAVWVRLRASGGVDSVRVLRLIEGGDVQSIYQKFHSLDPYFHHLIPGCTEIVVGVCYDTANNLKLQLKPDYKIVEIARWRRLPVFSSICFVWHLLQLIRTECITVVHSNSSYELGLYGWLCARVVGIPFAISVHAELQVLMNTNPFRYEDDLEGSKMYVYREDRHGLIKPARPCKYCESIMVDYGVKKVCYTTLYGWECEIL